MTNIQKAYIIRIAHPLSIERAEDCAKSCERVGLAYEFWKGSQDTPENILWDQEPLVIQCNHRYSIPTMNATRSHMLLWKHIYDNRETAIILEHDAYVYHNIDIVIPDGSIVALGYKLMNKDDYNYKTAGPPKNFVDIQHHHGAHAYAITWKTAELLLEELYKSGVRSCIDSGYFLRWNSWKTSIPLKIINPIMAVAWVRDEKSTVAWNSGAANHTPLPSFKENVTPHIR